MPFYKMGQFQANLVGVGSTELQTKPVEFRHYPAGPFLSVLLLILYALLLRYPTMFDAAYQRSKCWGLLPGVIGLVLVFFVPIKISFILMPLFILSLTFLAWRWLKLRRWFAASIIAFLVSAIFFSINMTLMNNRLPPISILLIFSAVSGIAFAFPMIALRIAVYKQATFLRIMIGLAIGFVLPFLGLALYLWLAGAPYYIYLYTLGTVACMSIPFALLIHYNAWVRDLATGNMFARQG